MKDFITKVIDFINKLKKKISDMLTEDAPNAWSAMRFNATETIFIANLSVWGMWLIFSICSWTLMDVPSSVVTLYSIAITTAFGGKWLQKKWENYFPSNDDNNDDEDIKDSDGKAVFPDNNK